jgi:hypothetical protein
MAINNERDYWDWVGDYRESVIDLIDEGVDREEALMQEADNMVIYYVDQRSIIRWTDHLDAIDEVGMPMEGSAMEVIGQIAFWSAYKDLEKGL